MQENQPIQPTDWKDICEKCQDGEIEPDCEYYGDPNGCNSPLYGQHPKQIPSCSPNCSIKQKVLTLDEAIAHAEECVDESPCGQNHRQLADWLKELKKVKFGGNNAAMREALVRVRGWLERMNKERLDAFAESQITPAYAVNSQAKTIIEDNEYHIGQIDAALAAPSAPVGNAAALREAAITAYDALDKLKSFSLQLGDVGRMREFSHIVCYAKNRLDAALAKPPRQCDVGTVEEQEDRFEKFCDDHKYVGEDGSNVCSRHCPCYNEMDCGIRWGQMPYEEGETDGSK